jgi:hypothetical protein
MSAITLAAVDGEALLKMMWTSAIAGLGATAVYAIAIFGAARAVDAGRSGRPVDAAMFGALAVTALVLVVAAVIFGLVAITDK